MALPFLTSPETQFDSTWEDTTCRRAQWIRAEVLRQKQFRWSTICLCKFHFIHIEYFLPCNLLIFLSVYCLKVPCIMLQRELWIHHSKISLCAILNYRDEGLVACPEVTHLILGNDHNVSTVSTRFCICCHASKAFVTMLHILSYGIILWMIIMIVLARRACSSVPGASLHSQWGRIYWIHQNQRAIWREYWSLMWSFCRFFSRCVTTCW